VATIFRDVYPSAARGMKQCRDAGEEPDVTGLPYWPELKHHRNVSIQTAYRQAAKDTDGRPPIVVSRDNRGPVLVTCGIDTFLRLCEADKALRGASGVVASAELDAADKRLREATAGLEPVDDDFCQAGSGSPAYLASVIDRLNTDDSNEDTIRLRELIAGQMLKTGTGE
jgi:hypothetical protein